MTPLVLVLALAIPSQLRICASKCTTYHVKQVALIDSPIDMGKTLYRKHEILLRRNMSDYDTAVTLQHEAMHAILWEAGVNDEDQNWPKLTPHDIIYLLDEPLVRLLRDNPALAEYILKAERP